MPERRAVSLARMSSTQAPGRAVWPLYAAGFTTAFGAHAVAATLGLPGRGGASSLLTLGILLALYDGAEVVLKPVFGALADRIGARPVLVAGLAGFALSSAAFAAAGDNAWLWAARLGQGAFAAAFSPAASALVAQLGGARRGRTLGSYGGFKSLGYTAGPLLGGVIVAAGGLRALFATSALLAAVVALWAVLAVPCPAPAPRARQSMADLFRALGQGAFWRPTAALAGAAAALSVAVGFLPVTGAGAGAGPVVTGAAVSVLALTSALVQPWAGRALDAGRLPVRAGLGAGLAITALGLAAAAIPQLPGLAAVLGAALLIGTGIALITPTGFSALAASAPPGHLGRTMGAGEVGRELGDAGGPLLVAAVATALGLDAGYLCLAAVLAAVALVTRGPAPLLNRA